MHTPKRPRQRNVPVPGGGRFRPGRAGVGWPGGLAEACRRAEARMNELTFHTRLHRAGTILDIGAHDGLLTLPFAALPGARVIAFEPLPSAHARLAEAVRTEYGRIPPHIQLRAEALGAAPGRAVLSVPVLGGVPQEQWASAAKDYAGFASVEVQRHDVPVITLDSLALDDVQHVKLDAEGFEQEVLLGGKETLLRCRPVLSLELEERHRPGSTQDVPALLARLGYETRFYLDDAFRPLSEFDAATMQVASADPAVFAASDPYVFTFYAWPRERSAEVLATLYR